MLLVGNRIVHVCLKSRPCDIKFQASYAAPLCFLLSDIEEFLQMRISFHVNIYGTRMSVFAVREDGAGGGGGRATRVIYYQ